MNACVDRVTEGNQWNDHKGAAGGFLGMLGINLLLTYVPLLVVNLHLMLVWHNNIMQRYETAIHIVVWGSSLAVTITPFALGLGGAVAGTVFALIDKHLLYWLLIPKAPLVFGSLLIHLGTAIWLLATAWRRTSYYETMRTQFRMQWRSWALAGATNLHFLIFLIYFFGTNAAEANTADRTTLWVQEWLNCVYRNAPNGQIACAELAQKNLPSDAFTEAALSIFCLSGMWSIIAVGSSPALLKEVLEVHFPATAAHLRTYVKKENGSKMVSTFLQSFVDADTPSTEGTTVVSEGSRFQSFPRRY
ncbi:hypothetical protein HK102_009840 [Quaeritorhiza haematococci]|nr:hypothetical protein HK102_009840 [Quaeritorhiza haematococci]